MPLNVAFLNEGKGITPTRVDNQATWHKNCRNRFSELTSSDTKKATRHSCTSTNISKESCFFL